ncbi:hypothetical protein KDA_55670 [Dictyobacter alpinus]|uniref:TsaA-like domain-containing protein n=1 Tax=Dictyobacter alpinus TaxID=2014873 RepID=A0A402BFB5_9CHLR|nr:hypothetical protein [Dictyobacter alpinus]GCE30083.1 hypothetical protein KDA_55670 [Dictyobacter alpinus]
MPEIDYLLSPVGFLRSALTKRENAPRQGNEGAPDAWLEVHSTVSGGLDGIAVGQDIIVITWFHQAQRDILKVYPRNDQTLPWQVFLRHDLLIVPIPLAYIG